MFEKLVDVGCLECNNTISSHRHLGIDFATCKSLRDSTSALSPPWCMYMYSETCTQLLSNSSKQQIKLCQVTKASLATVVCNESDLVLTIY